MSGGTDIEANVGLEVDSDPVNRAMDALVSRMGEIQRQVDQITSKAKAAAEALGGTSLETLQNFNKVVSVLDRFQSNLQKANPLGATYDKALAEQTKQNRPGQQQAAQEAAAFTKIDQQRAAEQQKLNDQLEREMLAREQEVARIQEQNQLKRLKDDKQYVVQQAEGIKELEALQIASINRIKELRAVRDTGNPEQERSALQLLAIEKQQLSTVTARIAEEQKAATSPIATRVAGQMDARSAKLDETSNLANASLERAQVRVAELQAQIAANIERAHVASEAERLEIEKMLVLDKERLSVADRQLASLERQAKKNATPTEVPGLLGKNGIVGVLAFSAAYGAAASAIYGVVSTIKESIAYAVEFQDKLEKLGAISNATGPELVELSKSINAVGVNSRFSTLELADAATELAKAGFTVGQIQESLKSVSQLAAATGSTLTQSVEAVTNSIDAFGLQTSEASHVSDVLTVALNRSKLSIDQMSQSIQATGELAHTSGMSFEEFTATVTAMSEAGLKSIATGTGLRQILEKLQDPNKQLVKIIKDLGLSLSDLNVAKLGLPEVMERLTKAGFDTADAYQIFGTRAGAAFLALKNNRELINQEIIAQNQLGAAAKAASQGQQSLTAEWQRSKNVLSDYVESALNPAIKGLQGYLKSMNDLGADPVVRQLRDQGIAAFFRGDGEAYVKAVQQINEYTSQVGQLRDVEAKNADQIEQTQTAVNKASDEYKKHTETLLSVDDATNQLFLREKQLKNDHVALQAETATLMTRFDGLAKYLDNATLSFDTLTSAVQKYRAEELKLQGVQLTTMWSQGMALKGQHFSDANQLMATARQNGTWGALGAPMQQQLLAVAAHPQDNVAFSQAQNSVEKLAGSAGRQFGEMWLSQVAQGTGAFVNASQAKQQLEVNAHLQSPVGLALQAEVSGLTGKDDAAKRAEIAKLSERMKGKSSSAQGAYLSLISQVQNMIGLGNDPKAPETKAKHNNLPQRQNAAFDSESLKVDEMALRNAIKDLLKTGGSSKDLTITKNRTLSTDQMKTNLEAVSDDLDQWEQDRRKQFEDELKKLKLDPNSGKGAEMQKLLDDEIRQKRQQVAQQVGAEVTKALQKMVDAVSEVAKMATDTAQHELNMAQARVTALSRQSYQTGGVGVPDYIQQSYERRAAQAKDQADKSQISINQTKIGGLQNAFDKGAAFLDMAQMFGLDDNAGDQAAEKALRDLHDQIVELTRANDELKASFQGGLIPQSLNEKLQIAVENYKQVNHLQASWTDMVAGDFTNALSTSQNALQSFFQDIISGNASVGQSFGNMAKAAIGYLSQLLAKMIAVKLMDAALNLFGNAWSGMTSAGINQGTDFSNLGAGTDFGTTWSGAGMNFQLHGGLIHALTGRYVTDGVPNRDSVPAMIAKGEYVVQKSAVDSVGVGFMEKLNKQGANALGAFAPKVVLPPPAHQQMSVFIVPPDQKPQMGPNDVLVTIADDIWRGGPTKQLIKQVAQGA